MAKLGESSLRQNLSRAGSSLLDLLLPLNCVVCGKEGQYICDGCEADLPRLKRPYCLICADPGVPQLCSWCYETSPRVDAIRAPYIYDGPVRDMVRDLKYRNVRAVAPALAGLLAKYLERNPYPVAALVPIPLHSKRLRQRGYNQSELVAKELSKLMGIPLATDLIRRVRNTRPQIEMETPDDRKRNIQGAFECTGNVEGISILLIDDVVTTGNTMSACAGELKAMGAGSIWGLALARQGRGEYPNTD